VSGATNESRDKWTLGIRVLSNQIPRASLRTTLTYRLHPRVSIGIEYNPRARDVGFLANVVAITETDRRPALIFGTSSDRIGTPSGRSIYATFSKNLSSVVHLPIAAYVGVAYGSYEHRFLPLAGLTVNWSANFSSLVIFDGVKVHPTITYALCRRHVFTFLLAQCKNPGASYSISF
jgi:hypothetical protein